MENYGKSFFGKCFYGKNLFGKENFRNLKRFINLISDLGKKTKLSKTVRNCYEFSRLIFNAFDQM